MLGKDLRRPAIGAATGVTVLQLLLLLPALPLSELLSDKPLFHVDSAFHWYQMRAAQAFAAAGELVGYDPWFAAGHLGGVSYNASAKLAAALGLLLAPVVPAEIAYKIYVLACSLLAPPLIAVAAAVLRLGRTATVAATLIGLLLWWISALRWYHTAGMVAFVFASYAALPYAASCWRASCGPVSPGRMLLLGMAGAFGLFLHPLFPLPVVALYLALVALHWRDIKVPALLVCCTILPAMALALNTFWMLPSIRNAGWADSTATPYQKHVDVWLLIHEAMGRSVGHARGAPINPALWLLTLYGLFTCRDDRLRRLLLSFALAATGLLIYSAFAAAIPILATTSPNRMSAAGYLVLSVPAAVAVGLVLEHWRQRDRGPRVAALATMIVIALSATYFALEVRREVLPVAGGRHGNLPPEIKGVGEDTQWMLDALAKHTDDGARVLFETSGGRAHDGAHIAGYVALTSRREFIGGPYVFMHHAGFWDGQLFGRPIESFSIEEFRDRMRRYNIGWAIVHSAASKAWLDGFPDAQSIAERGRLRMYLLNTRSGYLFEGEGHVSGRGFDEIILSGLRGPEVVLRYHFVPGLYTEPPSRIEPVSIGDDPQPFVRIVDPPPDLALHWRPVRHR